MSTEITRKNAKEDIDLARKHCGLNEISKKKRQCLKCNKFFISPGNWNRICEKCNGKTLPTENEPGEYKISRHLNRKGL